MLLHLFGQLINYMFIQDTKHASLFQHALVGIENVKCTWYTYEKIQDTEETEFEGPATQLGATADSYKCRMEALIISLLEMSVGICFLPLFTANITVLCRIMFQHFLSLEASF